MEQSNITTEAQIEAILYHEEDPVIIRRLAELCNASESEIESSLTQLEEDLEGRGVTLIRHNTRVSLGTAPGAASVIEQLVKEEHERSIGKAGMETLTIVAYLAPVEKPLIDYIRGVNSHATIRTLLTRGLIERQRKGKAHTYAPTTDTLKFLGIRSIEELPEYEKTRALFESSHEEATAQEEESPFS